MEISGRMWQDGTESNAIEQGMELEWLPWTRGLEGGNRSSFEQTAKLRWWLWPHRYRNGIFILAHRSREEDVKDVTVVSKGDLFPRDPEEPTLFQIRQAPPLGWTLRSCLPGLQGALVAGKDIDQQSMNTVKQRQL